MRAAARAAAAAPSSWSSLPSWSWVSRAPSPAALRRWPPGRSPRPAMSPGSRPRTSPCTRRRRPGSSSTGRCSAAVGRVETNHGRNRNGCAPNSAGAQGPMQFLPATFAHAAKLAHIADPDICDPVDAIPAAAAYLQVQRRPKALGPRPLPLQPGRLVPAARHALGRPLRVRRVGRLADRGADHPALRPDDVHRRAAALLRGHAATRTSTTGSTSRRRSGRPVLAIAAGRVILAGRVADGAVVVMIDHGAKVETLYGHLEPALAVSKGDQVAAGQLLGTVGLTGHTTGPAPPLRALARGEAHRSAHRAPGAPVIVDVGWVAGRLASLAPLAVAIVGLAVLLGPRRPSRARRAPARLRPGVGDGDRQARRRAAGAGRRRRGAWGRAHPGAPPPSASRLRCLARRLAAHRAPARLARWLARLGDRDQPPGRRPRHGAAARPVSRGGHRDERRPRPATGRHRDRPAGRSRRLAAAGGGGSRGPHPPCPRRGSRACPRRCTRCGSGASRGRCRPRPGGATWPPRRTRAPDRFDPSSAARSSTPSCSVRPLGTAPQAPVRLSPAEREAQARRRRGVVGFDVGLRLEVAGIAGPAAEALLWRLVHFTAELDDGHQAIRWKIRRGRGGGAPAARLADWELAQLW